MLVVGLDHGQMLKEHLKDALRELSCVFTDDQVRTRAICC